MNEQANVARDRRADNLQKAIDNTHPDHRPEARALYIAGWNAAYAYFLVHGLPKP